MGNRETLCLHQKVCIEVSDASHQSAVRPWVALENLQKFPLRSIVRQQQLRLELRGHLSRHGRSPKFCKRAAKTSNWRRPKSTPIYRPVSVRPDASYLDKARPVPSGFRPGRFLPGMSPSGYDQNKVCPGSYKTHQDCYKGL